MTSSFTTNKGIEKPAYQDYASDPTGWTVPVNTNWDTIDSAFGGTHSVSLTNVDVTLTTTQCRNVRIYLSGSLSGNVNIFFPSTISGLFVVADATTRNGYTISLKNAGAGVEFVSAVNAAYTFIWVDQATAGVYLADNSPVTGGSGISVVGSTISLSAPVSVANGGTGATTYTPGQLLIGNNAGGLTAATLTAGSNINITNGNGAITIAATGSAGGVTTFQTSLTGLTPSSASAGAVTLAGTLGVASGGTGGTDAATARSNLSAAASGAVTGSGLTVATGRLLGRTTASTGAIEEISVGSGLTLSGGQLSASGGAVSSVSASSSASGFSLSASPSTGAVAVSFGISSDNNARSSLGLGSIATQNSNNVSITGGSIGGNTSISTTGDGSFGRVTATVGTGSGTGYTFSSGNASFASFGGHTFINFSAYCSMYSSDSGTKLNWEVGNISNTQVMNITTSLFQVNSTDAAKPGGGSWIATSDVRVKKDIQDYTLSADALLTLRPVSYQYNGLYGTPENGKTYIGLIAQEVQDTPFSSMVGTYNYEGTQLLNLDTSQLVYALINAVQDLTARVKALEAKVP